VEWAGTSSPGEWLIATNMTRRHLTASQRAVVALDLQRRPRRPRPDPGRGVRDLAGLGQHRQQPADQFCLAEAGSAVDDRGAGEEVGQTHGMHSPSNFHLILVGHCVAGFRLLAPVM
jgi:hypothetical protein